MTHLRWGLIGASTIVRTGVGPVVGSAPGCSIRAVASRDLRRARRLQTELGAEEAYGSYEELLADDSVDVVYISLPNSLHHEWTLRSLEAGKHVLCEKPIAVNATEAASMFAAAKRHARLLVEGFMYRAHPRSIRARVLITAGAIGRITHIRASYCYNLATAQAGSGQAVADNIRMDRATGGGALLDVGSYCVDAILWYGAMEALRAIGVASSVSLAESRFTGILDLGHEIMGGFHSAIDSFGGSSVEVFGSEGKLTIPMAFRPPPSKKGHDLMLQTAAGISIETFPDINQYQAEIAACADAIRGNRDPLVSPEESLSNARVIDALKDSTSLRGFADDPRWVAVAPPTS